MKFGADRRVDFPALSMPAAVSIAGRVMKSAPTEKIAPGSARSGRG
jgi:hypothetical protein